MSVKPGITSAALRTERVPRGARRRGELVAVAESVFLSAGLSDVTMQQIALAAGASKETLYRHFGSKEALFAEVITNRARVLRLGLDADFEGPRSVRTVLHNLGVALLEILTSPDMVSLLRIVIAETPRNPALGQLFMTVGPERTRRDLAHFLEAARDRGEFNGTDAHLAASLFIGAVISQVHTAQLVLHDPPPWSRADIEARVGEAVDMFLARYQPRDKEHACIRSHSTHRSS